MQTSNAERYPYRVMLMLILVSLLTLYPQNVHAMQSEVRLDVVRGLAWNPTQDILAVSGIFNNQYAIYLVTSTAEPELFVEPDTGYSNDIFWSPDGSMLVGYTGSADGGDLIRLWSLAERAEVISIPVIGSSSTNQIGWSSDSNRLAFVRRNSIFVWNVNLKSQVAEFVFDNNSVPQAFAWQPSTHRIWIAGVDNHLRLWDTGTNQFVYDEPLAKYVTVLAATHEGSKLAIGHSDGSVTIWDTTTYQSIATFEAMQDDAVWIVEWALDGSQLAAAGSDEPIVIWAMMTRTITDQIVRQTDGFYEAIAFSPYGGRLAYSTNLLGVGAPPLNATSHNQILRSSFGEALQMVVPAPSTERLDAIATVCNLSPETKAALNQHTTTDLVAFTAQVTALPDTQITPGCRADLLAVAAALQASP